MVAESESRLPVPLSSFIGRQNEIQELRRLLRSSARLITLTGPGGVGKTRLALEFTARAADEFADGVFFVTFQALTEPGQALRTVATALHVQESGTRPLIDDLSAALANSHMLICIDNWEHVLGAAPQLADLLRACPRLNVVATSREALRLHGEHEYPVRALSVPGRADQRSFDNTQAEAVQLFIERARAVKPGFAVDESSVLTIGEICALLDGLPLAIELAAALLRLFSPQALLARLKSVPGLAGRSPTMELVVGGPRDLPVRQQTLRAAIDWSYNLLDPHAQQLFRRLAIFAGGCDLEAAEAVCGDPSFPRPVLDHLIALVDKSLIRAEQLDGEPRFDFLRTIYEYAREQLLASGELYPMQRRHAEFLLSFAERVRGELFGPNRITWLDRLEREHDNFRSALSWALAQGAAEFAARLGDSVVYLWLYRGHDREGREWLTRIVAAGGAVDPALRAKVLTALGQLEHQQGDLESAEEHLAEAYRLTEGIGNKRGMADALRGLGHVARLRNDLDSAISCWRDSLVLEHALGAEQFRVAGNLGLLAFALTGKGDYAEAFDHASQALAIAQEIGALPLLAENHLTLGDIALLQEDYAKASEFATKARALYAETKDLYGCAIADQTLGRIALASQKPGEAERLLIASLEVMEAVNDPLGCAEALEGLACLAVMRGFTQRAARLWGAAEAMRLRLGPVADDRNRWGYERYIEKARDQMRDKAFFSARDAGRAMSLDQAIHLALESAAADGSPPTRTDIRKSYPAGLTAREVDVLALVAQGMTDREVAERLVLSIRTVHAHLTSIYNKLGVSSRVAATRFAVEHKLV